MESIKKLKIISEKIKEKLGLKFYTRPQNYKALYKVKIKNLLPRDNQVNIILPIPPNTDYQKLKAGPQFIPSPSFIGAEKKFKNQFAWWRIKLNPSEEKIIQQIFEIKVRPRNHLNCHSERVPPEAGRPKNLVDIPTRSFTSSSPSFVGQKRDWALFRMTNRKYLESNKYLNSDNPKIKQLAAQIAGKEKNVFKIAKKINDYVINYLTYGNPIKGLYSAQEAIEKKEVDCGGFSALFAGLCMALKIHSRIIAGFWAGYKKNQMHAWAEFQLPDGQWIPCDPTIQHLRKQGRTFKSGGFGFVGSDRIALSLGCDLSLEIENQTINPVRNEISNGINADILQNPLVWAENKEKSFEIEIEFVTTALREP